MVADGVHPGAETVPIIQNAGKDDEEQRQKICTGTPATEPEKIFAKALSCNSNKLIDLPWVTIRIRPRSM